jgi:hypothetical protein
LGGGVKLDVKRVDTCIRVVLKQLLERIPEFGGGAIIVGDEDEELGRNPSINPLDDREIVFDPTRIHPSARPPSSSSCPPSWQLQQSQPTELRL